MTNLTDQSIEQILQSLPRRASPLGNRQKVWFAVQSEIRRTRIAEPSQSPRQSLFGILSLFRFNKFAVAGLMAIVVLGLVGGATKASKDSLPGETLYSVKKAAEIVEKALASSPEAKVKVGIKHAKRRLQEVQILVAEKETSEVVTETLGALKSETEQVMATAAEAKPELLQNVAALVDEEHEVLESVKEQADEKVKEAFSEAITASRETANKLSGSGGDDKVKGTTAAADPKEDEPTASTTSPIVKKSKPKLPKDGIVESPMIIHGVSKAEEPQTASTPENPKILSEPTLEF